MGEGELTYISVLSFDVTTFASSVATAVFLAIVIDWAKETTKKAVARLKKASVKVWREIKEWSNTLTFGA